MKKNKESLIEKFTEKVSGARKHDEDNEFVRAIQQAVAPTKEKNGGISTKQMVYLILGFLGIVTAGGAGFEFAGYTITKTDYVIEETSHDEIADILADSESAVRTELEFHIKDFEQYIELEKMRHGFDKTTRETYQKTIEEGLKDITDYLKELKD